MAEGIWTSYSFVLINNMEIIIICLVMITVFCVLSKKDPSKIDLDKERAGRQNARLEVVEQKLENPLNQSEEFSVESKDITALCGWCHCLG